MDYMDISRQRRTIRKYSDRKVEQDKLDKVLEAGRWSPTAVNAQPQRIIILEGDEDLSKVREFCSFGFDKKYVEYAKECDDKENGGLNFYYGAPLVLMICYDTEACWKHPESGRSSGPTDATIVAVNMMLEATSLGLGTAWISYFDEERARELLNIPSSWQPSSMLYIGYPAEDIEMNPLGGKRKPLDETCFYHHGPSE